VRKFAFLSAIGAALYYLFDPAKGAERRKVVMAKAGGLFGGGNSAGESTATASLGGSADDAAKEEPNDATLARKVETEIFRDQNVPKGQINVNAEDGVVYLRGEVAPDLIAELGQRAREVQGVLGVENLLHVAGEEAPTKPD
jgi:osmotically-inducible protein OsmY